MAAIANAYRQLVMKPIERRSSALFVLQLSQLLHDRTRGRSDNSIRRLVRPMRPKVSLPRSKFMNESAIAASVGTLRRRGWDILPWRLDAGSIAELRHFAFTTPAYARHPDERIDITEASIPHEAGRYMWRISDLVRVPAVQRLIADSAPHCVAQDYIGCLPVLTSITLWLDPVYRGEFDAHVYHYDNDGPSFLKFFIYLNDVGVESGAHTFIQGTHGRDKPRQFGRSGRYDRGDLLSFYGAENEIVFTGPAGMILAEDTAGFHKGTTLTNGYRLLMQLQYAMLDIPHEEEFVGGLDRTELYGLDPGIKRIARKFFA
jgi:hypothetical protein